ncbi:MAG TPA: polymer-forming cytoskeletal protein [Candidatus Udaeobacter sp.]|nr:polymer-forming cytoskeletal protein [Candidatus Udaeobacter sp.]
MKDEVRAKLAAASDGSASVQVSSYQSMVTDFLSSDVEIKGSIKFRNQLLIEGKVEGEIISDGVLTIGENAEIRGEIKAKSIIIFGNVHGNIAAAERCELKSKCILQGNLKAARLLMEEGATFVGQSEVTGESGPKSSDSSKRKWLAWT